MSALEIPIGQTDGVERTQDRHAGKVLTDAVGKRINYVFTPHHAAFHESGEKTQKRNAEKEPAGDDQPRCQVEKKDENQQQQWSEQGADDNPRSAANESLDGFDIVVEYTDQATAGLRSHHAQRQTAHVGKQALAESSAELKGTGVGFRQLDRQHGEAQKGDEQGRQPDP